MINTGICCCISRKSNSINTRRIPVAQTIEGRRLSNKQVIEFNRNITQVIVDVGESVVVEPTIPELIDIINYHINKKTIELIPKIDTIKWSQVINYLIGSGKQDKVSTYLHIARIQVPNFKLEQGKDPPNKNI